jgi:hypothetical protein
MLAGGRWAPSTVAAISATDAPHEPMTLNIEVRPTTDWGGSINQR